MTIFSEVRESDDIAPKGNEGLFRIFDLKTY